MATRQESIAKQMQVVSWHVAKESNDHTRTSPFTEQMSTQHSSSILHHGTAHGTRSNNAVDIFMNSSHGSLQADPPALTWRWQLPLAASPPVPSAAPLPH